MYGNFSDRMATVLEYVNEEALRLGDEKIGVEHLMLGIIREGEGTAVRTLNVLGLEMADLKRIIEEVVSVNRSKTLNFNSNEKGLTKQAKNILDKSLIELQSTDEKKIKTIHILLSIMRDQNNVIFSTLNKLRLDYKKILETYLNIQDKYSDNDSQESNNDDDLFEDPKKQKVSHSNKRSKTPTLDNFGRDLTLMASENKLDPIVGRHKEIERVSQILSRRKKNNPILIGEPGVGKSAIAEGLALRIVQRKVSRILFNKQIVMLDLAALVAGTKYRGQFEERMKGIITELNDNPDIILFIDEIHTLVGAGGASGSLDASNMFKPALARGELQCIGATTLDEYRQNIEKDGALERRFQKVIVDPTTPEETLEILHNIKDRYEEHHNVDYTDEALEACVNLTNRYMSDRYLPDKAIDALDEAGSRVHINNIVVPKNISDLENDLESIKLEKQEAISKQKFEDAASIRDKEKTVESKLEHAKNVWENQLKSNKELVTEVNVENVVSMMTGIPVQRVATHESNKLLNMPKNLKNNVIGQDDAVDKIVRAIKRNRVGLKDPNKPIGSFIFLGPTGVGKTQLAKSLSEEMFDSVDSLIRIDMSEYMEKFAVSRLVGAPPGYVGYEEGGQLTEKVRRKPYSIVLLDEIEKAHPDVFNILLQALDDGQLTDSMGRKICFKNTIIIMTSNIGSRQLKDFGQGVGFNTSSRKADIDSYSKGVIQKALSKSFAPEFLNRIDDVVIFNSLTKENINQIIDIELRGILSRIKDIGFSVKISQKAKNFIAEKGYDKNFGARPLKRAIQKYLEDPLAEEIISSGVSEGDSIKVDLKKDNAELTIKISKSKKKKKILDTNKEKTI
ncbi:MAG: Clp protease ClpC [Flavobacteriales bacterium]|nr:Clp protease ClpC [Flavobacteriales bacterium]